MANKSLVNVLISLGKVKKVPLSSTTLKRIFTLVLKELKGTPEYKRFCKVLGTPRKVEVHFCDDVEMRKFQNDFRKLDRTTDVLSFPSLEAPENSEKNFMGSLIVSLPTVERNAKRYKKTLSQELTEVYIHGILHLLSFDHVRVSKTKNERMRKVQAELYAKALKV